jgi:putative ABC transport system substrate-binding protein
MKKNSFCLALGAMLLALCSLVAAQQQARIPRIGYVLVGADPKTPASQVKAFRRGVRDLGYVEGKNIVIEFRYAEGKEDRIPSLVTELVELKVDVFVLQTLSSIRAAKQATKTIPIVMVTTQDPVATGIIDSLARPAGNITGLTRLTRELSGKRLELLKEVVPGMSRVGVLRGTDDPGAVIAFKEYEAAARALKIPLQSLEVRDSNPDLEGVFQAAAKGRANALVMVRSPMLRRDAKQIVGPCDKDPTACNVGGKRLRRGWRLHVLCD